MACLFFFFIFLFPRLPFSCHGSSCFFLCRFRTRRKSLVSVQRLKMNEYKWLESISFFFYVVRLMGSVICIFSHHCTCQKKPPVPGPLRLLVVLESYHGIRPSTNHLPGASHHVYHKEKSSMLSPSTL